MVKKKGVFQLTKASSRHLRPAKQVRPMDKALPGQGFPELKPIQGLMPDSKEEFWISLALDKLGYEYIYQYQVFGGNVMGGQKIDFWVLTAPLPTPLYIQSERWHGGSRALESKLKIQRVASEYFGQILPPIEIWDYEIPTPDMAVVVVKARLPS